MTASRRRKPFTPDSRVARAIIEHSVDPIVAFDEDGRIILFNQAAETLFGYATAEILDQPIDVLLQGERRAGPRISRIPTALWEKLATDRHCHESMGHTKNGEILDLELSVNQVGLNGTSLFAVIARDISLRKKKDAHTRYLAHFDSLTGLPNRILFEERAYQAIAQAKRMESTLAVMIIDLDHFKEINDTLGHQIGDRFLGQVAQRIRKAVRETDTVARLGGDEFAVLLTNLIDIDGAGTVAETLLLSLAEPFGIEDEAIGTTASIGIAAFPGDGESLNVLMRSADRALYRAKAKGRDNFQFYVPELDTQVQARKAIEHNIRNALEEGRLLIHYQPRVDPRGGICAIEALVRWQDPHRGIVPASDFIPVVERTDIIFRLGQWVLNTACRQMRLWHDSGLPALRLSVNLSAAELHHRDIVAIVRATLTETRLPPEMLTLEIGGATFIQLSTRDPDVIGGLRRLGVRLSIDDFGAESICLDSLRRHAIDDLEIDRSFITQIDRIPSECRLFGALVDLAHGLGARVSVEGVETQAQLDIVRASGVDEIQGFLLSPPVNADKCAALLRSGHPLIAQAGPANAHASQNC